MPHMNADVNIANLDIEESETEEDIWFGTD